MDSIIIGSSSCEWVEGMLLNLHSNELIVSFISLRCHSEIWGIGKKWVDSDALPMTGIRKLKSITACLQGVDYELSLCKSMYPVIGKKA